MARAEPVAHRQGAQSALERDLSTPALMIDFDAFEANLGHGGPRQTPPAASFVRTPRRVVDSGRKPAIDLTGLPLPPTPKRVPMRQENRSKTTSWPWRARQKAST